MDIMQVLDEAVKIDSSDVFIVAGLPLTYKVHGRQVRSEQPVLMAEEAKELISSIYKFCNRDSKHYQGEFVDDDFSFSVSHLGRFRANVFKQRGSLAAVLRVLRFGLPDPLALNIPEEVLGLSKLLKGLVLVTGPASNGKTTTLTCIIDRINRSREGHIITMEDPIEYVHQHEKSIVTQREINIDTVSYATALRAALREAPDVILLGEMRDLETIEIAMTAAETGQLLFSTLHTSGAASTVDRIVDVFPAQQQHQIRIQLSMVLQAVITQQLVPSVDGTLVPAFEIMFSNSAIRNLIREAKTHQIDSAIVACADAGMQTMDNSLFALYRKGVITAETALERCMHLESMQKKLDTIAV